jgi:hypothetical protein
LRPGNGGYSLTIELANPLCDFGLPSCLSIRIWGLIKAIQQGTGDGSASLGRESEGVLEDLSFGFVHEPILGAIQTRPPHRAKGQPNE